MVRLLSGAAANAHLAGLLEELGECGLATAVASLLVAATLAAFLATLRAGASVAISENDITDAEVLTLNEHPQVILTVVHDTDRGQDLVENLGTTVLIGNVGNELDETVTAEAEPDTTTRDDATNGNHLTGLAELLVIELEVVLSEGIKTILSDGLMSIVEQGGETVVAVTLVANAVKVTSLKQTRLIGGSAEYTMSEWGVKTQERIF